MADPGALANAVAGSGWARGAPGRLADLYSVLAPNPDAEYGSMPWSLWAVNRPGSAAWVQEGANPRMAMPSMVRDGLKGILDLVAGTETGEVTPEAVQSLVFGGLGAGASMAPRGAIAAGGARPIRAYHGSPHSFDRFDASKIGTGEGAQAYGHGLYFADREGVARSYRDRLSSPKFVEGRGLLPETEKWLAEYQSGAGIIRDLDSLKSYARGMYDPADPGSSLSMIGKDLFHAANEGRIGVQPPGGHMYEVNLHVDPARMLDWDKPLNKQGRFVRDAIRPLIAPERLAVQEYTDPRALAGWANPSGSMIYQNAPLAGKDSFKTSAAEASAALREAGITGVRYLDGGSRAAGEGSRNYVMFPGTENLIEILRKYGIAAPAPVAAPGAPPAAGNPRALRDLLAEDMVH